MTTKELNIQYICNKTLLDKDDELVPIILGMIKDSYKAGLSQSEFDNTMGLLEENQKLKEVIDKLNSKLNQYKSDLKTYQENDRINHQNVPIGLVGVKIRAFEDILKEV